MEQVIVARTDRSTSSRDAVEWASREALLRGLPLCVLHDPQPDPAEAKLVVLGMHRAASRPSLPASVPVSITPVVLVPENSGRPFTRPSGVVLGLDAHDPASAAIDFAFDSARLRGTRLHVVHAWRLPPSAAEFPFAVPEQDRATWEDHEVQLLADALRPWRSKYPDVPVLEDVVLLPPAEALLNHSANAALVVVGARAGGGRGDVTTALLRDTTCPVAVVRW
ncbi:universal stress protein [Streptomyces sp. NPDC092369]|uniref:universal stress protein n=1 Tax=Streptomyces sp. NPDC092369 TaxID=3366015 RepID=UPI0038180F88